jgi:hypothetical protein
MKKVIFGLPVLGTELDCLADAVSSDHMMLVSALGTVPRFLVEDVFKHNEDAQDAMREAQSIIGGLGIRWPKTQPEVITAMSEAPKDTMAWQMRNLLWMSATGSLVYLVTAANTALLDLATLLTTARILRIPTVGILPSGLRETLDSTTLTLTDYLATDVTARHLLDYVYLTAREDAEIKLAR